MAANPASRLGVSRAEASLRYTRRLVTALSNS